MPNNLCLNSIEVDHVNDKPKAGVTLPLTIDGLTIHQLLFYFNPLFDGGQQTILEIPTCRALLVFFDSLYLRWCCYPSDPSSDSNANSMSSIYYNMFPRLQQLCLSALRSYRISCGLEPAPPTNPPRSRINHSAVICSNALDSSDYFETEL